MRPLARVFTFVCPVLVQDEQNPGKRILLADLLQYPANPLFLFVFGERYQTLTVESVESDRRIVRLD